MSDRLPPRRRSGGGKHVATRRAQHPWTGIARVGVVSAMAVGLLLVIVDPSLGDAAATNPTSGAASQAAFARQVGPSQTVLADRAATRADIADVATEAVAQVADVRTKALQANLPAEQLATLDSLALQVDQLVAQVENPPRPPRSDERASGAVVAATVPADGTSATAGPTPTGDPSASAAGASVPSSSGSSSAAATPAAVTPATNAATPAPTASAAGGGATDVPGPTTPQIVVTDTASVEAALPAVTSADDPTAAALRTAVLALAEQVAQVSSATDDAEAAARAAADQATAEQAAAQAAAQMAAWRVSLRGYANGRIPASALCAPDFDASALLRCDAAQAIDQLNAAFAQAFGHNLTLDASYRSYAAQVRCIQIRGWLCAVPGTSNHGLGIAVDIGDAGSYGTAAYRWLTANGPTYGWHNPAWALASGSKHEPWHWEYVG